MAIPTESLKRNFIVVSDSATLPAVRDQVDASKDLWTYIVISHRNGEYTILRLKEIVDALKKAPASKLKKLLAGSLHETLALIGPSAAKPIEQSAMSLSQAKRLVNATLGGRLAVVANGIVSGVLAVESRTLTEAVAADWFERLTRASLPKEGEIKTKGHSLGFEPSVEGFEATRPALVAEEPEKRWINPELRDHAPGDVLEVGRIYTLTFDVDTEHRESSLVRDAGFGYRFGPTEESVDLTIQLSSSDFDILNEPQQLTIPRTGRSLGQALFEIKPRHAGVGVLNAVFLKDGNFIQLLTLKLNVGTNQSLVSESMSRPLESSFSVQPRDLVLLITNSGNAFKIVFAGAVYAEAALPITLPELEQMISDVRKALREVVNLEVGPDQTRVYQSGIEISPNVNRVALTHLAKAGFLLYQQIFYGPAADAQANLLGDRLREMSAQKQLKLQIVSHQFLIPWGLLYVASEFDPENVDPELFLGFKHIIEQIPLQQSMQVVESVINSRPNLTISLNVDAEIDQQMGMPLIADQLKYWKQVSENGGTNVVVRQTGDEVEKALVDSSQVEQILYFYCHAVSRGLGEAGGPDASSLELGGNKTLTLRDLKLRAPAKKPLSGSPLVFINACESVELSPLFYGGFVPYFMSRGARGVIGTESETPAIFAREWARRFFDTFLTGKPLGKVILDLRREFYFQHNNVMGLLYGIYCDGDTQIVPGVQLGKN